MRRVNKIVHGRNRLSQQEKLCLEKRSAHPDCIYWQGRRELILHGRGGVVRCNFSCSLRSYMWTTRHGGHRKTIMTEFHLWVFRASVCAQVTITKAGDNVENVCTPPVDNKVETVSKLYQYSNICIRFVDNMFQFYIAFSRLFQYTMCRTIHCRGQ